MKAFIVFLLFLIVACTALWIYVEREIATTSQPLTPQTYPAQKKNVPDTAVPPAPATTEIPSDVPDVSEQSEESPITDAASHPHEEHRHDEHVHETPPAEPARTRDDRLPSVSPLWQEPKTTAPNPDTTAPDAAAERYRAQLKEQHGDIPEVDMFIELHKRMFRDKKPITLDEHVRFAELANFFYPSPQNEAGVKRLRQLRRDAGGEVIVTTDPDKLPPNIPRP